MLSGYAYWCSKHYTLAIEKYQTYKLIDIECHSVARYELVDLIFFNS